MKILIIGGTGLISTAITEQLLARGDEVTHYNRGLSAQPVAGVRTIHGDRTDYATFEQQMAEAGRFDCVMDMVGYKPEDGPSVVQAFTGRTDHFIFCSTVDVYTKPAAHYPIREDAPREPSVEFSYAYHKAIIENTLLDAHARGDMPLTIIRPAYTYGEGRGMLSTLSGNSYLDRLRKGKPIVVHGDGSGFWTSCHRDDVARVFVAVAGNAHTIGKAYNATSNEWLTWEQYHHTVAAAIGAPEPNVVHISTDALLAAVPEQAWIIAVNFQFNNIFDTGVAQTDLAWQVEISLTEGVKRIVAWLEAHGGVPTNDGSFEDRLVVAWQRATDTLMQELA